MGTAQNRTHMIVSTKDRKEFFTANIGSDTITAIERAGDPPDWVVTQIPVGKAPEGIDISPDSKEVWTATWGDGGVSIIDVATKKVTQTLNLGAKRFNRLKFTPDGKQVLVSDLREDQVFVLDSGTRKEIKRLKVGGPSAGILMAPDGSRAYAAVTPDNSLAVIDLKSLEVTGRIPGIVGADGMAWAVRK
jgi:YVTN family beta-propeller protein